MPYPSSTLYPSAILFPGIPSDIPLSTIQVGSLLLNSTDNNGTTWAVEKFDGWGTPKPTMAPIQNVRRSGYTIGDSFSEGRVMTLTVTIVSATATQHSLDCDTLIGAFSRAGTNMFVSEAGRVRWCFVRRSAEIVPTHYNQVATSYIVQVTSPDWRKFGTQLSGITGMPTSTGGYTYPLKYPMEIAAVVSAGQVTLTNPGNETGPVWARIDGPITGPVIEHTSSGAQLIFSTSLALGAGEFLLIDMEKKTVLANGQSSRNTFITSRGWSGFDPGPNTWSLNAASFNASARLTVSANPSWE
jgi:hypothetical protein